MARSSVPCLCPTCGATWAEKPSVPYETAFLENGTIKSLQQCGPCAERSPLPLPAHELVQWIEGLCRESGLRFDIETFRQHIRIERLEDGCLRFTLPCPSPDGTLPNLN